MLTDYELMKEFLTESRNKDRDENFCEIAHHYELQLGKKFADFSVGDVKKIINTFKHISESRTFLSFTKAFINYKIVNGLKNDGVNQIEKIKDIDVYTITGKSTSPYFSHDQFLLKIAECEKSENKLYDICLLKCIYYNVGTLAELTNLKVSDIDIENQCIHVGDRIVNHDWITPQFLQDLLNVNKIGVLRYLRLTVQLEKSDYIFRMNKGHERKTDRLSNLFTRTLMKGKDINIPGFTKSGFFNYLIYLSDKVGFDYLKMLKNKKHKANEYQMEKFMQTVKACGERDSVSRLRMKYKDYLEKHLDN